MKRSTLLQVGREVIVAAIVATLFILLFAGCGPERVIAERPPPAALSDEESVSRAEAARIKAEADRRAAEAARLKAEREAANEREEAAKAKQAAQEAENDLRLGREAGRASIAQAATGVGWFGGLVAVASVVGLIGSSFFGGIGRKTALFGLAAAAGCIVVRYFLIVYGVIASETVSWCLILGAAGTALFAVLMLARYAVKTWNAQGLANKRAAQGATAMDAFALLPVPKSVKGALDDAWEYMRGPGDGDPLSESQAKRLLETYRLPVPVPTTK